MIPTREILRKYTKSVSPLSGLQILSAVRTPVGLVNGALSGFTAPQLGSLAINEALQRGVVPSEDLQNVFLGCSTNNHCHEELMKRIGLSKRAKISLVPTYGLTSLLEAARFLLTSNHSVNAAGEMESITNSSVASHFLGVNLGSDSLDSVELNKIAEQDYNNFIQAKANGAFHEEIIKIDFRKKGDQILVDEDEIFKKDGLTEGGCFFKNLPISGDGATAVIISTEDYSRRNNLIPLAKIISFGEECGNADDLASAQIIAIEKALKVAECECREITRWEILSVINKVIDSTRHYFDIDFSQVNKNGGVFSLGYPIGIPGVRAICHLVHSLSPGELGCAATCDFSGNSLAFIIKKLGLNKLEGKPQLRLYTKYPCPLCEDVKYQLKPFEGQFSLEEIDIELKENRKYKELYQYEIPVLFLNGVFLCKHRLDIEQFKRRLSASEGYLP